MGYRSSLHLINVKIKRKSIAAVKRALKTRTGRGMLRLRYFLSRAVLDDGGFLAFRASEDGYDPYVPDEQDGTVPALYSKWYEAECIAAWLRQHCEKGGRMILHSVEADGEAWGWEFDGRGRMIALQLSRVGKWE
jgi:YD repeat-containing protein